MLGFARCRFDRDRRRYGLRAAIGRQIVVDTYDRR